MRPRDSPAARHLPPPIRLCPQLSEGRKQRLSQGGSNSSRFNQLSYRRPLLLLASTFRGSARPPPATFSCGRRSPPSDRKRRWAALFGGGLDRCPCLQRLLPSTLINLGIFIRPAQRLAGFTLFGLLRVLSPIGQFQLLKLIGLSRLLRLFRQLRPVRLFRLPRLFRLCRRTRLLRLFNSLPVLRLLRLFRLRRMFRLFRDFLTR
jgi:hypothetical protein